MINYDEILLAFLKALEAADIKKEGTTDSIPIAWPNVNFQESEPYFRVNHIPVPAIAVGINSTNLYEGFIQVDVVVKEGVGGISPSQYAKQILSIFPRNKRLVEGSTEIGIRHPGYISPAIQQPDSYFIPVTIPYTAIN